ncbi:MAG: hypothetical protein E7377_01515 [Clostridiales bacterium]|nr:hypothetical protein [Clostridiales bacterium]
MGNIENKNGKKSADKKESLLVTKESLCSTCALFSFLALLILCTRSFIFGDLGLAVHSFLTGVFGYLAYPIVLGALYLCITGLFGKRLVHHRIFALCIALTLVFAALIVHSAYTFRWAREGYLSACFYSGETFPNTAPAGWLGGVIVHGVSAVMSNVGAIVTFSAFTAFCIYLCVIYFPKGGAIKEKKVKSEAGQAVQEVKAVQPETGHTERQPVMTQRPGVSLWEEPASTAKENTDGAFSPFGKPQDLRDSSVESPRSFEDSRSILFGGTPEENYKKNLIFDPNSSVNKRPSHVPEAATTSYTPSYTNSYEEEINSRVDPERPTMIVNDHTQDSYRLEVEEEEKEEPIVAPMTPIPSEQPTYQAPISYPTFEEKKPEPIRETDTSFGFGREERVEEPKEEYKRHDYMELFSPSNPNLFGREEPAFRDEPVREEPSNRFDVSREIGFGRREETFSTRDSEDRFDNERGGDRDGLTIFDEPEEEEEDIYTLRSEPTVPTRGFGRDIPETSAVESSRGISERGLDNAGVRGLGDRFVQESRTPVAPKPEPKPADPPKPRVIRPYKRIPLDDFDCRDIEPTSNAEEVEETKQNIIATLEDFKVTGASIASVTFGPTVTRYNVTLPRSISPRKVVALDQSIAISLHSSGVNIYPNYEDGVVSIEVPNKERQFVQLGCMLSGDTFVNAKSSSLMFTMGKDVANAKVYGDISKMIHLLVAGSSGSGKSVFLGALIVSMIYKYSPEELRLILIDPKKTEFVLYNNLPHLMINEIITDVNKAVQSLNWAIGEMNRRYGLFEQMSRAGTYVVNLDQYNAQLEKSQRLPKIVIIIDELADLMLAAKKEMEDRIQNLTQKARAAGIHLIVATQRPSTDVITGVIKSNLPTRIAFYVATDVDSRVILDQTGAQKLLGKGDFLYTMPGKSSPGRVQSAFISPEDSQRVVNYIKANNEAYYDEEATAYINNTRTGGDDSSPTDKADLDPMYIEALRYVILSGSASISMIQRKCSAGYNRAGKIIEWMEDMGYISAFDGAKARKVLITKEDFESIYGPLQ